MAIYYDEFETREYLKREEEEYSSFYGRHRYTKVEMHPKLLFKLPINDICGPHMVFEYPPRFGRPNTSTITK